MKPPLISVIVPVFKVEHYLEKCLDSLLVQTHNNLEIILVDDGSPDRCGIICDSYAEKDFRIRVIHRENRGLSAARNTGLDVATGEYIAFLDSDDWIYPQMYEHLLSLLVRYRADMAQCAAESNVTKAHPNDEKLNLWCGRELIDQAVFGGFVIPVWCNLYSGAIWKGLRFEEGYYYEDSLILPHVAQRCRLCVKTNRIFYYYTRREGGILRRTKEEKHLKSQMHVYESYAQLAQQSPDLQAVLAYYICSSIPSYRQIVQPGPNITKQRAKQHNRELHALFCRHFGDAKAYKGYKTVPAFKKVLWSIYCLSPKVERFLLKHYRRLHDIPEEMET